MQEVFRCVAGEGAKGERVWLTFRVLDGDGVPVPDAMIELWQADSEGNYSSDEGTSGDETFSGFGRLATAEDGSCTFETIRPGRVPGPGNTLQAPHINVSVFARGLLKRLSTRVYFAGDPANCQDPVLALVPEQQARDVVRSALIRLAKAVGYKKSACVEKARRYFSMCNHLRMIGRLCSAVSGCYHDPAQGAIMSMRLIDSLATTPRPGRAVF